MHSRVARALVCVIAVGLLALVVCASQGWAGQAATQEAGKEVKAMEKKDAAGSQPASTQSAAADKGQDKAPRVVMETSMGQIVIELDREKAPVTVANFLKYVDKGFFNDTIFHRIVPGFVIQGGGFDSDHKQKETDAPITNECRNGLKNLRGTLSMARTNDPNSATCQFFINLVDNRALDYPNNGGYAVFGKVVEGMAVVDEIAKVHTGSRQVTVQTPIGPRKQVFTDVPETPVVVRSAKRQ